MNLKQARKAKNLTQTQLGELVGVTDQTIRNIEQGKHEPGLSKALKLKRILPRLNIDSLRVKEKGEHKVLTTVECEGR
jgi:DNA-binding XRE family transcriptional regulator